MVMGNGGWCYVAAVLLVTVMGDGMLVVVVDHGG